MKRLLLFIGILPLLTFAQQDYFKWFPATAPVLGSDSIKMWVHVPANYPATGGKVMLGLHGLGDPNTSTAIRTYLTPTADNYNILLVCPEPYIGQEDTTKRRQTKAVIKQVMDSIKAIYNTDLTQTYICGYSAGSDAAAHYTLEDPVYPIKGFIWYAPGFYGSLLYPNIDTAYAAPIPPICMCIGTQDNVSAFAAPKIESTFSGSEVPFLKVEPQGIGHTMNYPAFTADIATCMDFINAQYTTGIDDAPGIAAKIYPNPANHTLTIQSQQALKQVQMFNVTGEAVLSQHVNNPANKTFDISALSNGIYVLKLITVDGRFATARVVKQ